MATRFELQGKYIRPPVHASGRIWQVSTFGEAFHNALRFKSARLPPQTLLLGHPEYGMPLDAFASSTKRPVRRTVYPALTGSVLFRPGQLLKPGPGPPPFHRAMTSTPTRLHTPLEPRFVSKRCT